MLSYFADHKSQRRVANAAETKLKATEETEKFPSMCKATC